MEGFFRDDLLERLAQLDEDAEFLDSYHTYVRRWRDCENSLSEDFSLSM